MSQTVNIGCPFCKSEVIVDLGWAIINERVFCNTCCKSFEVAPVNHHEASHRENTSSRQGPLREEYDDGIPL